MYSSRGGDLLYVAVRISSSYDLDIIDSVSSG